MKSRPSLVALSQRLSFRVLNVVIGTEPLLKPLLQLKLSWRPIGTTVQGDSSGGIVQGDSSGGIKFKLLGLMSEYKLASLRRRTLLVNLVIRLLIVMKST